MASSAPASSVSSTAAPDVCFVEEKEEEEEGQRKRGAASRRVDVSSIEGTLHKIMLQNTRISRLVWPRAERFNPQLAPSLDGGGRDCC
mmetsp:Transcript_17367/g.34661  ORF Transcript_17367/g.34661 Transcript_17367/m.34661 type:complete len:88 (+) Transcript_17367:1-264(+)